MGKPISEVLERWSARELQELYLLAAVQAEERGDLPPPPPDDPDEDDEPELDEPTEDDIEAMVKAERERISRLPKESA